MRLERLAEFTGGVAEGVEWHEPRIVYAPQGYEDEIHLEFPDANYERASDVHDDIQALGGGKLVVHWDAPPRIVLRRDWRRLVREQLAVAVMTWCDDENLARRIMSEVKPEELSETQVNEAVRYASSGRRDWVEAALFGVNNDHSVFLCQSCGRVFRSDPEEPGDGIYDADDGRNLCEDCFGKETP